MATSSTAATRPQNPTILRATALTKSFDGNAILHGIDMSVRAGEVIFIIGPSGSGKSTFLRCLNFLEVPDSGTIEFAGETLCAGDDVTFHTARDNTVRAIRSQMPMVFQQFNLFRHKTVLENVTEGPVFVQKRSKKEAVAEAMVILEGIGLAERANFYPAQLSGGQQQRVGIARALAMRPKLILFDEPTSALDPELVSEILESIQKLASLGMTMIIVTHEMAFARKLADKVYFMADGRVVEAGTPGEIFEKPRSERLQSFMRAMLK